MRVLFIILLLANLALAGIAYWAPSRTIEPPRAELNSDKVKLLDPNDSASSAPADTSQVKRGNR